MHPNLEQYIRVYGYLGIVVWAFLGGEECVIIASLLASKGFFSLPGVILASAIGGALGDQVYFYLAYKYGKSILRGSARAGRAYARAKELVEKYGVAVVLPSRFLVGLRITVSVVCGLFRIPPLTYSVLNCISALVWASLYGTLAYYSGRAARGRISTMSGGWLWVIGLLLIGGYACWRTRFWRQRAPIHDEHLDRG